MRREHAMRQSEYPADYRAFFNARSAEWKRRFEYLVFCGKGGSLITKKIALAFSALIKKRERFPFY